MTQNQINFEQAQILRMQALELNQTLFCMYHGQSTITLAAVPDKERWQAEFKRLQKIIRIWNKSTVRLERRRSICEANL